MELYDEGIKLTREDMNEFSKMMNIIFPEKYVEFLLNSNGGTPEEDLVFDFIDAASNKRISTDIREFFVFYKNDESSYDDIVKVNKKMKSEKLISDEYFVFADDSAGNPICMKTAGSDVGSIYFCNHELEDADEGYLLMSRVADSFSGFIESLYVLG